MMFFSELIDSTTSTTWIVAGVVAAAFVVQAIYYLFIFRRISAGVPLREQDKTVPVSVVICARNEAENLEKHLPLFLSQDHDNYEVVVVNDCSTDHTDEVLMDLKEQHAHLKVSTISQDHKFSHGKKLAITVGIKAASNDYLLFSDADCYPETDQWIHMMTRHFNEKTEIVLGVGKYERKRSMLNLLVRYETLFTALQYISTALRGKPYMGVGRNLAYTRPLFFRNKGFASHLKLQSGDDDLFIKETATRNNTAIETGPESFTISVPPSTFGSWIRQKRRHITTGKYYRGSTKFRLAAEYISRILFYTSIVILLFQDHWKWIALCIYGLLSIIKLIRVKWVMRRLNEKDLLLPSLLIDPLLPLILGMLRVANIFRPREHKWN